MTKPSTILYEENQRLETLFPIALTAISLVMGLALLMSGKAENKYVFMAMSPGLLFSILFAVSKLRVQYLSNGIQIKYFPFQRKTVFVPWKDISGATIRETKIIKEYRGYGVRHTSSFGKAWIACGNKGLQLDLVNGERWFVGCQDVDRIAAIVKTYVSKK